ncbi:unnamed protein product [Rhizophagus irregularis]|nr:unnamed protein product [Rhizophagus irregularis]
MSDPSDLELLKQLNTELEAENVGLGVLRQRNAEVEEILAKLILNSRSNFAKLKTKTRSLGGNLRAESRNWRRVERILMLKTPNSSLGLEVVSEAVDVSDSLVDPSSNAAEVKPDERVTSSEQESRHVQSNNSPNNSSSNSNSITEPKVSTKGEIDVEDFLNEKLKLRKQENVSEEIKQRNERKGLIWILPDDHDDSTDSKEVSEAIIKTADYDDDPFKIFEDEEDPFDEILEEESN